MTVTQEQSTWFAEAFTTMVDNVDKAVLGKEHIVRLAFTCMLSEGHLGPAPKPTVTISRGEWVYVDPAECPSGQCYRVIPHIRNFPPQTEWSVTCSASNYGSPFTSAAKLRVTNPDTYEWNGRCAFGVNVGTVTVKLTNSTHGSYSGSMFWS